MSVSCPFIIQKAGSITLHEESLWLCSDRSTVRGNAVRGAHDCRNQQNDSKEWRADMGQKCWRTILFLLSPPHTYSRLHSWHSCWDGVTSVCSTPALYSENQTYCCLCNPVSKTCEWNHPRLFLYFGASTLSHTDYQAAVWQRRLGAEAAPCCLSPIWHVKGWFSPV